MLLCLKNWITGIGKKLFAHKLSIPSRNLYQEVDLGVTWVILRIKWQNVTIDRGELVTSVSGDKTWQNAQILHLIKIPRWNRKLVYKKFFSHPVNLIVAYHINFNPLLWVVMRKKGGRMEVLVQGYRLIWWNTSLPIPSNKIFRTVFLIKSARSVNTKCDNSITKFDDWYKVQQNIARRSLSGESRVK